MRVTSRLGFLRHFLWIFFLAFCGCKDSGIALPSEPIVVPPDDSTPPDDDDNDDDPVDDVPVDDDDDDLDDVDPREDEGPGDDDDEEEASFSTALPTYWSRWVTDGDVALVLEDGFIARGFRCRGNYCDDSSLLGYDTELPYKGQWWTDEFSEEGNNSRICDDDGFMVGLSCKGNYCDNIALRCANFEGVTRTDCTWAGAISDDGAGEFIAPGGAYIAGVRCSGRYCDNRELYLCRMNTPRPSIDIEALAKRFAPRLRFDSEFGTGSGGDKKCFPSDPASYYEGRKNGDEPQELCDQDFWDAITGYVPTFYSAERVGDTGVVIRYWFFYAWQSNCALSMFGSHAADWESVAVYIENNELVRVAFHQHGGFYSKEVGQFEQVEGTDHPIGYVGKNSHGTYHDAGGSGGCIYFEDYRNPGSADRFMDTWYNLVPLRRGEGAPEWMNCEGSDCFDGIGHPIEQNGNLIGRPGCYDAGCERSSIGGVVPFVHNSTGTEATVITAAHSSMVLGVRDESLDNSATIQQFNETGSDSQHFVFEEVVSGRFSAWVRHSGRCLDIIGAGVDPGHNLGQYSCSRALNQQFSFVPHDEDGSHSIRTGHSGLCIGVADESMDEGAAVVQQSCTGADNQRFYFSPAR